MRFQLVIVEDDHDQRFILETLTAGHPRISLVGTPDSREALLRLLDAEDTSIDVAVVDLDLYGKLDGLLCVADVHQRFPNALIIVHTIFEDNDTVFKAIRAGATGYILKSNAPLELIQGIEEILAGKVPISPKIARRIMAVIRGGERQINTPKLTTREIQILTMIGDGFSFSRIADDLHISINTIYTHVKNIYAKLQVTSREEAVLKARQMTII